jgi:hypothetical protein
MELAPNLFSLVPKRILNHGMVKKHCLIDDSGYLIEEGCCQQPQWLDTELWEMLDVWQLG